jgi:hypothetical protein
VRVAQAGVPAVRDQHPVVEVAPSPGELLSYKVRRDPLTGALQPGAALVLAAASQGRVPPDTQTPTAPVEPTLTRAEEESLLAQVQAKDIQRSDYWAKCYNDAAPGQARADIYGLFIAANWAAALRQGTLRDCHPGVLKTCEPGLSLQRSARS